MAVVSASRCPQAGPVGVAGDHFPQVVAPAMVVAAVAAAAAAAAAVMAEIVTGNGQGRNPFIIAL